LYSAEVWLLPMLPIDIVTPIAVARIRAIGRDSKNLRKISGPGPAPASNSRNAALTRVCAQCYTGV
jgi:hypothetical protein